MGPPRRAPPIKQALLAVLARDDVGYPGEDTLQALREAFAGRMADRFGWQADPARVMPVGGLIQALIASVATFCPGGGGVVVQTPIYYVPLASLGPEIAARTITLSSATKAFNIAGLKCAVIHFGSQELMTRQTAVFADRLLGIPNVLGIEATLAAWREGGEWLEAVLAQLSANRDEVARFVAARLPGVVHHRAEASYFAWLDFGALELPAHPYEFFLSEARVAFSDGRQFDPRAPQCVRLNFATPPAILRQVLERTGEAVERVVPDA